METHPVILPKIPLRDALGNCRIYVFTHNIIPSGFNTSNNVVHCRNVGLRVDLPDTGADDLCGIVEAVIGSSIDWLGECLR